MLYLPTISPFVCHQLYATVLLSSFSLFFQFSHNFFNLIIYLVMFTQPASISLCYLQATYVLKLVNKV